MLNEAAWRSRILLGEQWVEPDGDYAVVEPATGAELSRMGRASADDVRTAAAVAVDAQREWAARPHRERAAVMRRAGDLWHERADDVAWWNIREVGAVPGMADFAIGVAADECYEAASLPSHPSGRLLATDQERMSFARRMPAGVVGVIAPFNVPIILGIRAVAPALALGNAVILKPDPRTAVTGGVAIASIFAEAGLPPGLLQMLPGGADVGEALVTDPDVRVVAFTGSTAAGRKVGELAGRHLTRAHLELGGNSAYVVLADADVDQAVNLAAWGAYFHQGQICMTVGRHLVHESLYDEYVQRLADKADALPVGNPATDDVALGPVIDVAQRDAIHAKVVGSQRAGAKLHAGGEYDALYYRPTVLADSPADAPAHAEEVFGPVASVVPFGSDAEAVSLASAGDYGLSLGIVTRDVMRGLELAERIPSGIAHVNDQTVNDEANAPFGGVGQSGTGARHGGAEANIDAFTETRWVTVRGEPPTYPY